MEAAEFLLTAERLLNSSAPSEADFRSSVSRAYYAVFLTIRGELKKRIGAELRHRIGLSREPGHEWVVMVLTACNVPEMMAIGKALANLRSARHKADYDLNAFVDKSKAQREVENAKDLLNDIALFGLPKISAAVVQHLSQRGS